MSDSVPRTPKSVIQLVVITQCASLGLLVVSLAFSVVWQTVTGWAPTWELASSFKEILLFLLGSVAGILTSARIRQDSPEKPQPENQNENS